MAELSPGDPIQRKAYSWENEPGVFISTDADSLLLLNPGVREADYPALKRFRNTGLLPRKGSHPSDRVVFQGKEELPLGLSVHPLVAPRAAAFDGAALALLEAAAPGEAEALRTAPEEEILVFCSDFTSALRSRTPNAFRMTAGVHEIESRDMVMMDWDWNWYVLARPAIVAGLFVGDSKDWVRLFTGEGVPPAAVAAFLATVTKR